MLDAVVLYLINGNVGSRPYKQVVQINIPRQFPSFPISCHSNLLGEAKFQFYSMGTSDFSLANFY